MVMRHPRVKGPILIERFITPSGNKMYSATQDNGRVLVIRATFAETDEELREEANKAISAAF